MYQLTQQYKLRDILLVKYNNGVPTIYVDNMFTQYEDRFIDKTDPNYRRVVFDDLNAYTYGGNKCSYINSTLFCNIDDGLSIYLTYNNERNRYLRVCIDNIYFKYKNCTINYDNPIEFLTDLKLKILNVIEKYCRKHEYIQELYQLTNEDFQTIQTSINASAINDNTTLEKPLDNMAEYVSNQLGNKIKESTVSAILRKIDTLREDVMLDFINEVKPLFISVIPQQNYFYGD